MKIGITGANGFIGSAVSKYLNSKGHEIFKLPRKAPYPEFLKDFDIIINLAGENIASKRWSKTQKEKISKSRIEGTRELVSAISKQAKNLSLFISASAIGIYGEQGDEILTEDSASGEGFFAELARAWEAESKILQEKNIRVVNPRFGVVLGKDGGALKKMLLPFKFGAGAVLGSGKQYMSWVSLEDSVRALEFIIDNQSISGACNIVSPNPVTNREFTRALASALKRPAFFRIPEWVIKIIFGEMGKEALLTSTRVVPEKLLKSGFEFKDSDILGAVKK